MLIHHSHKVQISLLPEVFPHSVNWEVYIMLKSPQKLIPVSFPLTNENFTLMAIESSINFFYVFSHLLNMEIMLLHWTVFFSITY